MLESNRNELMEIDAEINRLLERRNSLAVAPNREDFASQQIAQIIGSTRSQVANPVVIYQGVEGSNTHEAACAHFGGGAAYIGEPSFERICRAVAENRGHYGVLPLENNTTGPVARVRELIRRYGLYIVGEQNIRIEHCLMGIPGASQVDIKEIRSHEQAIMQCGEFLDSLTGVAAVSGPNTAICARDIARAGDKSVGAIASPFAASLYGLNILRTAISDNPNNCTRFVVLSKTPELSENRDKVSMLFSVSHEVGTLQRVLFSLSQQGFNLTKLESFPVGGADFEYLFLTDFIGDLAETRTQEALQTMGQHCSYLRILGNYKHRRRNIVLIGMPGSGKNAIGEELAPRIGMTHVDTDEMIERSSGRTIPQIFAEDGEPAFREMEARVTEEASALSGCVISTGGGTVMREDNARALRRTGLVFFIDRPMEMILAGVDLSGRPLLADNPSRIYELYKTRQPTYLAVADHHIVNRGALEDTVGAMDKLTQYLRGGVEA